MHIILFGGTFDPPHLAHQRIAEILLTQNLANEVWYVPCKTHPFGKVSTPSSHRLAMLELVTQPKTKVCTYEIEHSKISYSYTTLKHFQETQPKNTFSWLIGSDQLESFNKWKSYELILKEFKVFVYPRKNFPFQPLYEGMIPLKQVPEIEISSTEIREMIKQGMNVAEYLDPQVMEYITINKLYQLHTPDV